MLGVDDFALKRRHRYATIPTDADALETWLRTHPGAEIVCRDGSSACGEAIRRGLPDAVQVSDRWHLRKDLCDKTLAEIPSHNACWATVNAPQPVGVHGQATRERWQQIHDLLDKSVGLLECEALRRGPRYRPTSPMLTAITCGSDAPPTRRSRTSSRSPRSKHSAVPAASTCSRLHHPRPSRRRPSAITPRGLARLAAASPNSSPRAEDNDAKPTWWITVTRAADLPRPHEENHATAVRPSQVGLLPPPHPAAAMTTQRHRLRTQLSRPGARCRSGSGYENLSRDLRGHAVPVAFRTRTGRCPSGLHRGPHTGQPAYTPDPKPGQRRHDDRDADGTSHMPRHAISALACPVLRKILVAPGRLRQRVGIRRFIEDRRQTAGLLARTPRFTIRYRFTDWNEREHDRPGPSKECQASRNDRDTKQHPILK